MRGLGHVSSMRLVALVVLIGCGAACHGVVELDRPPNAGASAVLLIVARGELAAAVRAIDRDHPDWSPFSTRAGDVVYALSFSCAAARLGLEPGLQALSDDRATVLRVPPPAAVYRVEPGDAAAGWVAHTGELPPAVLDGLGRLPLPEDALCHAVGARYTPVPVVLPPDDERGEPAFALGLDGDRVVAATRNDRIFIVERDGTATRVPRHEAKHLRAGVRGPDGTTWYVDLQGALWRGAIDGELESVAGAPLAVTQRRIGLAISGAGAPLELYATAEAEDGHQRTLLVFDGRAWAELGRARGDTGLPFYPAVAWVGPGEAIAIGLHPTLYNGVARVRDGALRPEALPGGAGPSSLLHHPTLGALVGRDDGEIDRDVGGWIELGETAGKAFVRNIVPEGDGFTYTAALEVNYTSSVVGQWHPTIGFCPTAEVLTDSAIVRLVRLGEDTLVALAVSGSNKPTDITLLRQSQAAGSCSAPE